MGKTLDAIIFSLFGFSSVLYMLLSSGIKMNISLILSSLIFLSLYIILKAVFSFRFPLTRHKRKLLAEKRVKSLIYQEPEKAHISVFSYLQKRYPLKNPSFSSGRLYFIEGEGEKAALCVLQKLRVNPDDILTAWRTHGKTSQIKSLVVAVPGKSETEIKAAAYRLTNPSVVILDKPMLRKLFAKYEKSEAPDERIRRIPAFTALRSYVTRRRSFRYLLYALVLIANYIFFGKKLYLISGLFLLTLSLFGMYLPKEPESLI
ncbi:MAG: hypothetical protein IJC48_10155 [Clostridia bacterium]|nr:hypothetical protein [Clostridia bacterium]